MTESSRVSVIHCWTNLQREAPEGQANAGFLAAAERAREQEVREISTSDEDNDADGAEEKKQGGFRASKDLILIGSQHDAAAEIGIREIAFELCGDRG